MELKQEIEQWHNHIKMVSNSVESENFKLYNYDRDKTSHSHNQQPWQNLVKTRNKCTLEHGFLHWSEFDSKNIFSYSFFWSFKLKCIKSQKKLVLLVVAMVVVVGNFFWLSVLNFWQEFDKRVEPNSKINPITFES